MHVHRGYVEQVLNVFRSNGLALTMDTFKVRIFKERDLVSFIRFM